MRRTRKYGGKRRSRGRIAGTHGVPDPTVGSQEESRRNRGYLGKRAALRSTTE